MKEFTMKEFYEEMKMDAYEERAREQEEAKLEYELGTNIEAFEEHFMEEIEEARSIIKALSNKYQMYGHDFDVRELEY